MPDIKKLRNRAGGYPIGFTESMYYVEEADAERAVGWYRNRRGWDTDWGNFEQFYENSKGQIDYNILHDEKGAGTLTDWPRPETRLENWAKHEFEGVGDSPPPIPDPPDVPDVPDVPPPVEPSAWRVPIDNENVTKIELGPIIVQGGSEALVYNNTYVLGKQGKYLDGIWIFNGLDRGNVVEMDTEVFDGAKPLALRSFHKEYLANFDSWVYYPVGRIIEKEVNVHVLNRTNGKDMIHDETGLASRPHWGIYFNWEPDMDWGLEPDAPLPVIPEPESRPTDYIPWEDRFEWSDKVDHAYTQWRGHVDLLYLASHLDYVHGKGYLLGLTSSQLNVLIETMEMAQVRQVALMERIKTERHSLYPDRSQVRKSVANDMYNELTMLTREYGDISNGIILMKGCDSIKCRIKKWKAEE
jgi:hypothetical protein